ncbi:MAG: four helix bundle protein [Verrucomicrobia bacterium]|nr:four helix bundle protein [Verrucomicrobiota bacterium]MBV8485157.1 four helix bundle protein [Verrucomicrobiota bacterium]
MGVARSFRDLRVYELARKAVSEIFEVAKGFPREERHELTNQIRRSARATKALIAEGWARRRYRAAFISKIDEALGEATETQSWLDDALDRGYMTSDQFKRMDDDWSEITSMLARMMDRSDDFCKYSSDTDYRGIVKEDSLEADDSFFNALDEKTP